MKLLVLDLDETLIFATVEPLQRTADFRIGPYHVYKRPGLLQFLRVVQAQYALAVWTSSSESYAQAVVAEMIPADVPLRFVWSRERCTRRFDPEQQNYEWSKNLDKLKRHGYQLSEVVMVDDTPRKLDRHYGNLVRVREFLGDPADAELQLLAPYLCSLAGMGNIRTVEKRNWRQSKGS